jgi:hypothetical protein
MFFQQLSALLYPFALQRQQPSDGYGALHTRCRSSEGEHRNNEDNIPQPIDSYCWQVLFFERLMHQYGLAKTKWPCYPNPFASCRIDSSTNTGIQQVVKGFWDTMHSMPEWFTSITEAIKKEEK